MNREVIELEAVKRIAYISDLNINHRNDIEVLCKDMQYSGDTGLIILGNISNHHVVTIEAINELSKYFVWVVFVLGNQEYYTQTPTKRPRLGLARMHTFFKTVYDLEYSMRSVYFLHSEVVYKVNDFYLIGDTLWTDYFNGDMEEMNYAYGYHPNFKMIVNDSTDALITPENLFQFHHLQLWNIKQSLDEFKNKKVILCTHHAPTLQGIESTYIDLRTNASNASDLDYLFREYPNIKYALHGGREFNCSYLVSKTLLLNSYLVSPTMGFNTIVLHRELNDLVY